MVIFRYETKIGKEGFTIIPQFVIRLRIMKSLQPLALFLLCLDGLNVVFMVYSQHILSRHLVNDCQYCLWIQCPAFLKILTLCLVDMFHTFPHLALFVANHCWLHSICHPTSFFSGLNCAAHYLSWVTLQPYACLPLGFSDGRHQPRMFLLYSLPSLDRSSGYSCLSVPAASQAGPLPGF